jgi:hypothetical protein
MVQRVWVFSSIPSIGGLALLFGLAAPPAPAATIGMNFTGVTLADGMTLNDNDGYAPPDNGGAVGPSHIVQLINGAYAVYDKSTGTQTQLMAAKQFWTSAGVNPGDDIVNLGTFNARILYDPTVDRWIAAALTGQSTNNSVMIARSDTSNPAGTWKAVSFLGNDGGSGKFADFTALGVDADGVYVTTNNYPANVPDIGFEYVVGHSLPKADVLAGTPTAANRTTFEQEILGYSVQPVIDFGPSKGHAPLVAILPTNPDEPSLFRVDILGATGPGATLSEESYLTVSGYVAPPKAAQPDLTRSVSTVDGGITSHAYQVGDTIYAVHNTKVGANAALSVILLDEPSNQVIDEIILGDPNFDYFNGSIAANALGDIVVGFTRSGLSEGGNLSACALIGHTENGDTTFGTPLLLKDGTVDNYHIFNDRWGDWTTTVVDPANPLAFWTFQQYAFFDEELQANAWATQITEIVVPEPGGIILAAAALAALVAAARRRRRGTAAGSV